MVLQQDVDELARWDESPTTADAIAAALAKIWRRAGGTRPDADGNSAEPGVLRTRVANIVAFAPSDEQSERADRVLEELVARHPVRSMLIGTDPSLGAQELRASLRVYCRPMLDRRLCFERIHITAGAQQLPELAGILTQLLVPDLPSILWWLGEPSYERPEFAELADLAGVVLVDSGECEAQLDGLVALAQLAGSRGDRVTGDLNWNRLGDWRELIAQFFDSSATRPLLESIDRVSLDVCKQTGDSCTSVQALLLAGWLGSRLGWELQGASLSGDQIQIEMHQASRSIPIQINPVERSSALPGWLCSVAIEASGPSGAVKFSLQASDGEGHGTATIESAGGQTSERSFALDDRSDAALVEDELQALGRERALAEALAAAGLIARRLIA